MDNTEIAMHERDRFTGEETNQAGETPSVGRQRTAAEILLVGLPSFPASQQRLRVRSVLHKSHHRVPRDRSPSDALASVRSDHPFTVK